MCDAWTFRQSPPLVDGFRHPRLTMYTVGRGEHSRPSDFIQLCGVSLSGPQRPNSAEYVLCHKTGAPRVSPRTLPARGTSSSVGPHLPPIRGKYASISPLR